MTGVSLLRAGPVSVTYEAGALRYIRCDGVEVLRRIYVAVRDHQWATPAGRITHENIESGEDWFRIDLTAEHRHREIAFSWQGHIEGARDGSIRFTMCGSAASSFCANRMGFCVLHPIDGCAGRACTVEHTSGATESAAFPELISPHQPFLDVRAISHEVAPGVTARVLMEGDVFETEDQRNWTDDSFKTYSRPLTLPYPYRVHVGERVNQSVSLTFDGTLPPDRSTAGIVRLIMGDDVPSPFPQIFRRRIDLHLNSAGWRQQLESAASGGPVECAIFTGNPDAELAALETALEHSRPQVSRWLIFNAEGTITSPAAVAALRRLCPGVPVGGGSNTNFAELNRNRQWIEGLDFVSWAINPQAHAVDEQTLIENLRGQRPGVETARTFCGGLPLTISTIAIPHPPATAVPWVVGSIKHLAEAGVQSITYRDIPGAEAIFAQVEEFAPERAITSLSGDPLSAEILAMRNGSRIRILLANLLGTEQNVLVCGTRRETLRPYGVAAIDWVG